MANSNFKRKTRSDKFPLTLHPTGQFCKKIKGKLYYFGVDKQKALERYLEQAAVLHIGKSSHTFSFHDNISIKTLCNLYLEFQELKRHGGDLTSRHFSDQVKILRNFTRFMGQHRLVNEISALDLQNYKRKLVKTYNSRHRINLNIAVIKALFHWAKKNEVLKNIPNIDAINKMKIVHQSKPVFTTEEIRSLLNKAGAQIQAIILLGLNCGFGGTDCSELLWTNIDFKKARIQFPRVKTGFDRNLPLWPETLQALNALSRKNERVFNTIRGHKWIRTVPPVVIPAAETLVLKV